MKRTLACLSAAPIAFGVNAATLVPVQLLNPAGSGVGQSIVSTGPITAPGFANMPVANVTGAAPSASPTFTGVPAAPNAAGGTNTTQIATTAFVLGSLGAAPQRYLQYDRLPSRVHDDQRNRSDLTDIDSRHQGNGDK